MITVKFKKVRENATMPEKAYDTSVGYDLTAAHVEYKPEIDTYVYYIGLATETNVDTSTVPHQIHGEFCFTGSRNRKTECYLANSVGIIDSDEYRGEIQLSYKNRTSLETMIKMETLNQVMHRLYDQHSMTNLGMGSTFGRMKYEDIYDFIYRQVKQKFIERATNLEFAPYKQGDVVGQMVFATTEPVIIQEVEELNMNTERGTGGHGSTKK